jgi:flagellar operon protein
MIKNVGMQPPVAEGVKTPQVGKVDGDVFKGLLNEKVSSQTHEAEQNVQNTMQPALDSLKFSSHAIERIQSRGIKLDPTDMKKLNDAVDKAVQKGSKETLVIMGDNAFVVSAKNKTVITAMDKNMMIENVFTNIDSTILV